MDLTDTIAPRSDQINAEDLLTGPRTVTVTEVRRGQSDEQPVEIVTAEFGRARPFRPSKTVRRLLILAWGNDGDAFVGRRMTLYRDPAVRFGSEAVGGIRVSHLSHISKPMKVALTSTRGKKQAHAIEPLPDEPTTASRSVTDAITPEQTRELVARLRDNDLGEKADALTYVSRVIGRDIGSSKELTATEAAAVIASLPTAPAGDAAIAGTEQ